MFIDCSDGKRVVNFRLNLLEIHEDKLIIPEIQYSTKISINSIEFHNICKNCLDINDYLIIKCSQTNIEFEVCGLQQKGSIQYTSIKSSENQDLFVELLHNVNDEHIEQSFLVKYLQMFSNVCIVSNNIILQLHKEYPLCIHCNIKIGGYIKYYLSPQITD